MKKPSTFPASEWAKCHANPMSTQVASRLCRDGRVKGAKQYFGRWMVPVGTPDPRLERGEHLNTKGTPDPRHPVGAPKKAVK